MRGRPRKDLVSTSAVKRQNLTMRMSMKRFTRRTSAFSKRIENHAHAVALHFMYYNFCRIHRSIYIAPALAAHVTRWIWEIREIVEMVEETMPPPDPRGPYKKSNSN